MNINYEITGDDLWSFNKYVMFNIPKFRRSFIVNLISIPFILFGVGIFLRFSLINLIFSVVIATAVYYFFAMALMKRKIIKLNRKKEGVLGNQSMEVSYTGVKVTTKESSSEISWKKIRNIVDAKQHIYFFLTDQFAYIIPKRVFTTGSDLDQFLNNAKSFLDKYGVKK
jgi:hypothetical protein